MIVEWMSMSRWEEQRTKYYASSSEDLNIVKIKKMLAIKLHFEIFVRRNHHQIDVEGEIFNE